MSAIIAQPSTGMSEVLKRVWTSPTANTWVSLFTRSVSLVLVLPLVLRKFTPEETAVWFVFSAVLSVQGILGFGFSPSFARLLAYARAGAEVEQMIDLRDGRAIASTQSINWHSLDRLVSCMSRVFTALAAVSLLVMGTLGTAAVWRPITAAGHQPAIWAAWAVIAVASSLSFLLTHYTCVLQGMDRLIEWRRWETVLSLGAIVTSFVTLLLGGRLLAVIIGNQLWTVIGLWAYRSLCAQIEGGQLQRLGKQRWEPLVFRLVWNSAWKSGLTTILTFGLVQSTGVIQAQFGSPASTTTYNLMLRIVTLLSQVVQAPFLTKLPELARRRAIGDSAGQLSLIRRGMRLTHWSIVAVVVAVAVGMPLGLKLIGSRSVTFDPVLWAIFGLNLFFERHGGMLHQIRNLTNQPMEHFGMFGYFAVNVTLMLALHSVLGMYAYPLAMLGTQLLFSTWFTAAIAYPVIGVKPLIFERSVSLPPLLTLVIVTALLLWK